LALHFGNGNNEGGWQVLILPAAFSISATVLSDEKAECG
jgi:hypothetical protein